MIVDEAVLFENLNFSYPDGHIALRNVNLRIRDGEKVALVGPNGAGKSTLLLHFNGILMGDGRMRIYGNDLKNGNLRKIRSLVGLVFQNPDDQLFSPTVFEDVAFGPIYQGLSEDEVKKQVEQALESVHMKDYAQRVSYHLSIGEKKRISIATVLSMNPKILVLDEPSAGLDPRSRRSLIHLLSELPQTLIAATHDLALVRELLPRTIIMNGGKIIADGRTSDLLQNTTLLLENGLEPL